MFKCVECNKTFFKPKKISYESYYGVGSLFRTSTNTNKYIEVCPYCEDTIYVETEIINNNSDIEMEMYDRCE